MSRIKDQALCIRCFEWSETSQIVVFLSKEHGKIRGLAKGARRTDKSHVAKYSGGIDLLTMGQIVGITRTTSELATLTEWDLQEPFRHFRTNWRAQCLGLYVADLLHAMVADHDPHPTLFEDALICLAALGDVKTQSPALLRFVWNLLETCGYRPEIFADVQSGEILKDQNSYLFDARAGGLISDGGNENNPTEFNNDKLGDNTNSFRVRRETVECLRALCDSQTPVNRAAKPPSQEVIDRANRLLCVYVRTILGQDLPTMGFVLNRG